jgi:sulfur-carrier protein
MTAPLGDRAMSEVRVVLPAHLKNLAKVHGEVLLDVPGPLSQRTVLDALEERYPMLRGTIRDRATGRRRAFIRFYACEQDLSNEPPDAPLPGDIAAAIAAGKDPFMVVGAMAGG